MYQFDDVQKKISKLLISGYSDVEIISKLNISEGFYNSKVDEIKRFLMK